MYLCLCAYVYDIVYVDTRIKGGQNYLLPAMDMAKVGGTVSVVMVCICE